MATPAMIIIYRVTWTLASFCWAPSLFGLGTFVQLRSPSTVLTLPSSKRRVCDDVAYEKNIAKARVPSIIRFCCMWVDLHVHWIPIETCLAILQHKTLAFGWTKMCASFTFCILITNSALHITVLVAFRHVRLSVLWAPPLLMTWKLLFFVNCHRKWQSNWLICCVW